MNFRYLITVSLLFVLTAATLHGQSRRRHPVVPATLHIEDLPQQPLDTLATDDPETRIIIFSNNTWRYYRPALKVRDSLPVYMQIGIPRRFSLIKASLTRIYRRWWI